MKAGNWVVLRDCEVRAVTAKKETAINQAKILLNEQLDKRGVAVAYVTDFYEVTFTPNITHSSVDDKETKN